MSFQSLQESQRLPRIDQFTGCLLGQCLGDALGFPVEGYSPAFCQDYVTNVLQAGLSLGREPFSFGQYTDDSQLARELMQSFVDCGRFDPADYAQHVAAIFVEGRIVGRGQATQLAALRLAQGVPWQRAGTPPPAAGNGSAMRAGPIGLFYFYDPERLVAAAVDQGCMTHQDSRSSAGAVAIAAAVALALSGSQIEPVNFLAHLAPLIGQINPVMAGGVRRLNEWLALEPAAAVDAISSYGLEPGQGEPWPGISPYVVSSVLWSLYAFLRTPDDYWESILTAIAVGGDVDTTAAMTGAISGAYLGLGALPAGLVQRVHDRDAWAYPELVELAQQVYALVVD